MADPQEMIQTARVAAFNRVQAALMQVNGNLIPNLPPLITDVLRKEQQNPTGRAIDPFEAARLRARLLASEFFDWENPNMEQIAEILHLMKTKLSSPSLPLVISGPNDPLCGTRGGYCAVGQGPIHLCPFFFLEVGEPGLPPRSEQRIRTMIHEAAHLVGIGDSKKEDYYTVYDGHPGGIAGFDTADAWGHYVHVVGFQPLDPPPMSVPGSDPPPGPTPPGTLPGTTPPGGTPPPAGPKIHTVVYGDYLTKLAQIYYGDPQLWRRIYAANRAVIGPDPSKIYPGQKLVIP